MARRMPAGSVIAPRLRMLLVAFARGLSGSVHPRTPARPAFFPPAGLPSRLVRYG